MTTAPHLLQYSNGTVLSRQLFADLQAERILSEAAIAVLQKPCDAREILRRQELFRLLENGEITARVEGCLSALQELSRVLTLWKDAEIATDRYHLLARVLRAYVTACESLAAMSDCGGPFADAALWTAEAEIQALLTEVRTDLGRANAQLQCMRRGLISFSDKIWLTPDRGAGEDTDGHAVSEFERIAACAEALGFAAPRRRTMNGKIERSLADALCRLYPSETEALEGLCGKYADLPLSEPTALIHDIKFLLEIRALVGRAAQIGVPHTYPIVESTPTLEAARLYDVSLLGKNCEHIVPNGADFSEKEPFFFLTGANGGGKTTYLRAVGLNLVLFLAGCPVFAETARMYPFAVVAAHFPHDERFDGVGRLDEERARAAEMLDAAQGKTAFLLFNETFSGADERRGFALLRETADKLRRMGAFGLYVTHFHEVMGTEFPVLSAQVDGEDENRRTYRIVKSKGTASSYAADILKKYGLDKQSLTARRCTHGN